MSSRLATQLIFIFFFDDDEGDNTTLYSQGNGAIIKPESKTSLHKLSLKK